MSEFSVDIRRVVRVWDHPNAQKLSLAAVEGLGFQFVTGKDAYKVGDYVVYFPVDSVMPLDVQKAFGLEGKLTGKQKDRLKTVKLRGEISQGFVAPVDEVLKLCSFEGCATDIPMYIIDDISEDDAESLLAYDLSTALGVSKYEQPPIACHAGNLVQLPDGVSMYDIEGVERYPEVVNALLPRHVVITEKVEGQNYGVTSREGETIVNQRKHAITPIEGKVHSLHAITTELGIDKLADKVREQLGATQVTLRGEYLGPGIQKNIYKFPKNTVRMFDILADGKYVEWTVVLGLFVAIPELADLWVPVIEQDMTLDEYLTSVGLDVDSISTVGYGKSKLNPQTLREGVVIKPVAEFEVDGFGRAIIKQRDPEYLAEYGF
jgi:RNA ligase (TIGR02306 family)